MGLKRKVPWQGPIEVVDLTVNSSDPEPDSEITAEAALASFASAKSHNSSWHRELPDPREQPSADTNDLEIAPEQALKTWEPRTQSLESSFAQKKTSLNNALKEKEHVQAISRTPLPSSSQSLRQNGVKRQRVDKESTASVLAASQELLPAQKPSNSLINQAKNLKSNSLPGQRTIKLDLRQNQSGVRAHGTSSRSPAAIQRPRHHSQISRENSFKGQAPVEGSDPNERVKLSGSVTTSSSTSNPSHKMSTSHLSKHVSTPAPPAPNSLDTSGYGTAYYRPLAPAPAAPTLPVSAGMVSAAARSPLAETARAGTAFAQSASASASASSALKRSMPATRSTNGSSAPNSFSHPSSQIASRNSVQLDTAATVSSKATSSPAALPYTPPASLHSKPGISESRQPNTLAPGIPSREVAHSTAGSPQHVSAMPLGHHVPSDTAAASNGAQNEATSSAEIVQKPERQDALSIIEQYSDLSEAEVTAALVDLVARKREQVTNTTSWTPEEDALLIHAKEQLHLQWEKLWERFLPYRGTSWATTQSRYSQKLTPRARPTVGPLVQGPSVQSSFMQSPSVLSPSVQGQSIQSAVGPHSRAGGTGGVNDPSRPSLAQSAPRTSTRQQPLSAQQVAVSAPEASYDSPAGGDNSPGYFSGHRHLRRTRQTTQERVLLSTIRYNSTPQRSRQSVDEKGRNEAALASMSLKIRRVRSMDTKVARYRTIERRSLEFHRPYLNNDERQYLKHSIQQRLWAVEEMESWQDSVLHVDFNHEEAEDLYPAVLQVMGADDLPPESPLLERLAHELKSAEDDQILRIARYAQGMGGVCNRTIDSLQSFLRDLRHKEFNGATSYDRISLAKKEPLKPNLTSLCRSRELGGLSRNVLSRQSQRAAEDTYGPLWFFNGTSGDVNCTAWSANATDFAIGSAALTDNHSMQYNRPYNLLFGSLARRRLKEISSHATKRIPPTSGVNASASMQASQDPILYQSVSAVQFSADGEALISTGYDQFVRVTDVRTRSIRSWAAGHNAKVDVLAVNPKHASTFATGSQDFAGQGIKIFQYDLDADSGAYTISPQSSFYSPKARQHPEKQLYPSSLQWGPSIYNQHKYLLAGFTSSIQGREEGEVCMWDVEHGQQSVIQRGNRNVFDIAWSPIIFGRFAVASSAVHSGTHRVNKGMNSIVRIYDSRLPPDSTIAVNTQRTYELECPARDINDVVFSPSDGHLISVGCTDGYTYLWDVRRPDELLHQFGHGTPASEANEEIEREDIDTGVRFLSWGGTRQLLYTGSSDGVVAKWDPYRAPPDACMGEVIQLESGVMSGSFSPDFSHLLLGEVRGAVTMLSVGQNDRGLRDCKQAPLDKMGDEALRQTYRALGIESPSKSKSKSSLRPSESGIVAARSLLECQEISIKPFGDLPFRQAVQGPNYTLPPDRASDADEFRAKAKLFQEQFKISEDYRAAGNATPEQGLLTEEEMGDNGAWKARIPANIRFTEPGSKVKPQRFDCFRCDGTLKRQGTPDDTLTCDVCEGSWRMDVLGYRLVSTPNRASSEGNTRTGLYEAIEEAFKAASAQGLDFDEEIDQLQLQGIESYVQKLWGTEPRSRSNV